MKTKITTSLMTIAFLPVYSNEAVSNGPVSYVIGGIIALLILGYLVYTLLHPENF
jgi:K+-transporting ATPase KdpF subunit